jgi:DNA-binding transcriptional ArsR family regulator
MKQSNSSKSCVRTLRDAQQIERCKQLISTDHAEMADAAGKFAICGSPLRLSILRLLDVEKELCVCDLAEILEVSVAGASQQLRKLREAGAITSRRAGNTIYHSVTPDFHQCLRRATDLFTQPALP